MHWARLCCTAAQRAQERRSTPRAAERQAAAPSARPLAGPEPLWLLRRLNPYAEYAYDGIYLNPLEVLFVKVKGFTIDGDWTSPKMAATYDRWATHQVPS